MVSDVQSVSVFMPVAESDGARVRDEEFSRRVLRDGIPPLGLSVDEILRRSCPDAAA